MMANAASSLRRGNDVLRDLLHFVSQPLTALHCALESSMAQAETEGSEDVFLALEQADRVIEAVRLMREYLDAEQGCSPAALVSLTSTLDNVLEQLSVLAQAGGVRLFACGASKAAIPIREAWLQRILIYLVGAMLETAQPGNAITVLLEDGASQSVVSGHSFPARSSSGLPSHRAPVANVLRQVKLAIAQRALESTGASVEVYADDKPGFTIRIPRSGAARNELSA